MQDIHTLIDHLRTELEPEGAAFRIRDLRSAGLIIDGFLDSGVFVLVTDWDSGDDQYEVGIYLNEDEWLEGVDPVLYQRHLTADGIVATLRDYDEGGR